MPTALPTTSLFYDLVYHGLSFLPVLRSDASNLYDRRYIGWAEQRLAGKRKGPLPRTLPADAARLAALYDRCPQAYRLHAFVLLHHDLDDFMESAHLPFDDVKWSDATSRRMAHALREQLPLDLLELWRIALWSEVEAGFEAFHRQHLAPAYARGLAWLADQIRASGVPGLDPAHLLVSLPLRRAGRLLWRRPAAPPRIVVGLGHKELDVPQGAPVIQACHEHLLALQQPLQTQTTTPRHTRPDQAGYAAFLLAEVQALALDARWLAEGPLARDFAKWLAHLFANGASDLAARLPWVPSQPPPTNAADSASPTEALITWLAAGGPLPAAQLDSLALQAAQLQSAAPSRSGT